jgi:hypothetical protein
MWVQNSPYLKAAMSDQASTNSPPDGVLLTLDRNLIISAQQSGADVLEVFP